MKKQTEVMIEDTSWIDQLGSEAPCSKSRKGTNGGELRGTGSFGLGGLLAARGAAGSFRGATGSSGRLLAA